MTVLRGWGTPSRRYAHGSPVRLKGAAVLSAALPEMLAGVHDLFGFGFFLNF